jgi:non-ribosomal peptide synthetase component E (peptide arylation enzyme)
VVGVPGGRRLEEEVVTAIVVPREGAEVKLGDLGDLLKQKEVAAYKLPRRLVVVESLPRNAVGKVLKHEIKRQLGEAPA